MKLIKYIRSLFARRIKVEDISNQDIIIVVIGPTGAGKSTFINMATKGEEASINHGLASCTGEVMSVKCAYPGDKQDRSVVFVDTPAFNHDTKTDAEIGRAILRWIIKTYDRKNTIAGILYLHRISDTRMTELPLSHLMMFQNACGGYLTPKRVVLATTMWSHVDTTKATAREKEIEEVYWNTMMDLGSRIVRFEDTQASAWKVVETVLGDQ